MPHHAADHAWHSSDGFEDDGAVALALREEGVGEEAQESRDAECDPVAEALSLVVAAQIGHGANMACVA
jgi:hypothetical protein